MIRGPRNDIGSALDVLANLEPSSEDVDIESVADLVDYGIGLCANKNCLADEPVRTIHHLSCTGGTLFSKCLASMPNTLVLNEVNLGSRMLFDEQKKSKFTPTDLTALLRQGDPTTPDELINEIFIENIRILRKFCWREGRTLILRDHSHSQFLFGEVKKDLQTMSDLLGTAFPVRSVVTTRTPRNAFESMRKYGWHEHFEPPTFSEYQRRVDTFLAMYSDVPVVRYEDFTKAPKQVMRTLCDILDIEFYDKFEDVFSCFRFSGDSGRGGDRIVNYSQSGEIPE